MISGKRILADFKVYSRGYLRNRVGLFFGMVFPVILILIFGAIFSGNSSGTTTVYVQNQDTGPFVTPQFNVAGQFIDGLNSTNTLNVVMVSSHSFADSGASCRGQYPSGHFGDSCFGSRENSRMSHCVILK